MSSFSRSRFSSGAEPDPVLSLSPRMWLIPCRISVKLCMVFGDRCVEGETSPFVSVVVVGTGTTEGATARSWTSFSSKDFSRVPISVSRSFKTSCKRMISFSRLETERSPLFRFGREMDRFGRMRGDADSGLLVPLLVPLEKDILRECAEESSCESDTDCDSDLHAPFSKANV